SLRGYRVPRPASSPRRQVPAHRRGDGVREPPRGAAPPRSLPRRLPGRRSRQGARHGARGRSGGSRTSLARERRLRQSRRRVPPLARRHPVRAHPHRRKHGAGAPVIKVGVIGLGTAALTGHLPALAASSRFELVALLDTRKEQVDAASDRFPAPHRCSESDAFFALPELEAVIVATPPDSHAVLAGEALRAGKHVLVEKPLARTVEESRSLVDLAGAGGLTLSVGHEKRFHPSLERVRELLEQDAIGTPFYCGVHWASAAKLDPDRLVPEGFRDGYTWRWRDRSVGGGIVQDHLPHYVDLVRHWTKGAPEGVYAHCLNTARDL